MPVKAYIVLEYLTTGERLEFKIDSEDVKELLNLLFTNTISGKCKRPLPVWKFVEIKPEHFPSNKARLLLRLIPLHHYLTNPYDFIEAVKKAVEGRYLPSLIEKIAFLFEPRCQFNPMLGAYHIAPPTLNVTQKDDLTIISEGRDYSKYSKECRKLAELSDLEEIAKFLLYHCPHSLTVIQKGDWLIEKNVKILDGDMKIAEVVVFREKEQVVSMKAVVIEALKEIMIDTNALQFGGEEKFMITKSTSLKEAFEFLAKELSRPVLRHNLKITKLFNSCLIWPNGDRICLKTKEVKIWPTEIRRTVSLIEAELILIEGSEIKTKKRFIVPLIKNVPHKVFEGEKAKELLKLYSKLHEFFSSNIEVISGFVDGVFPFSFEKVILVMKPVFRRQIVPVIIADAILRRVQKPEGNLESVRVVEVEFELPWVKKVVTARFPREEFERLFSTWNNDKV